MCTISKKKENMGPRRSREDSMAARTGIKGVHTWRNKLHIDRTHLCPETHSHKMHNTCNPICPT